MHGERKGRQYSECDGDGAGGGLPETPRRRLAESSLRRHLSTGVCWCHEAKVDGVGSARGQGERAVCVWAVLPSPPSVSWLERVSIQTCTQKSSCGSFCGWPWWGRRTQSRRRVRDGGVCRGLAEEQRAVAQRAAAQRAVAQRAAAQRAAGQRSWRAARFSGHVSARGCGGSEAGGASGKWRWSAVVEGGGRWRRRTEGPGVRPERERGGDRVRVHVALNKDPRSAMSPRASTGRGTSGGLRPHVLVGFAVVVHLRVPGNDVLHRNLRRLINHNPR